MKFLTRLLHLTLEFDREDDGRFIAEVVEIPGCLVYGATPEQAIAKVEALALRVIADRLENNEMTSGPMTNLNSSGLFAQLAYNAYLTEINERLTMNDQDFKTAFTHIAELHERLTMNDIDVEIPKKWLQALKFAEMVKGRLDMDIPPAEMVMLIVSLSRGNESVAQVKATFDLP